MCSSDLNAGQAHSAPFGKTDLALWQRMLDVNLTGTFLCTQAALPGMLEQGWGRIVNVASTAGLIGYGYVSAYCAAKHGVIGLTRALALELARASLCEQVSGQGACGQCPSCHSIEVRTHADLCVLMPEETMLELGWPLSEKAQAEIDDKKRKPSKEIRIDAMRETIEFTQRTSARGRGKVVLVFPAERMNHVTANAQIGRAHV